MSITSVSSPSLAASPESASERAATAAFKESRPHAGSALAVAPMRLTVVARRHPWRWVGVVVVLVLVAQVINGLATNPGWDWPTFAQFFATKTIIEALWTTVQLTIYGTLLGFEIGRASCRERV